MTDTVRDVVVRVRVEQAKGRGSAVTVETKDAEAALKRTAALADQVESKAGKAASAATKAGADAAKAGAEATGGTLAKQAADIDKARGEYLKFGSAMKATGEGAFVLARGLALVTASNEEQMAAMIKNVAVAQGAFDLYKGAFEVTKGVTESMVALKAATGAATAAQAIQIATVSTLSKAYLALHASLGPIGLALAGISAAVVAGHAAWTMYADAQESASQKTLEALRAEKRATEELLQARNLLGLKAVREDLSLTFGRSSALRSIARPDTGNYQTALADLERRQAGDRAASISGLNDAAKLLGLPLAAPDLRNFDLAGAQKLAQQAGQQTRINYQALMPRLDDSGENLESTYFHGGGPKVTTASGQDLPTAMEGEIQRMKARQELIREYSSSLVSVAEQERGYREERLRLMTTELGRTKELVEAEKSKVAAIQEAIQAEKNRGLSLTQKFGAMSKPEQQQIVSLSEKVKSGGIDSLNPGELQYLRGTGFADSLISRRDLAAGQSAGANQVFQNFGTMLPDAVQVASGADPLKTLAEALKEQQAAREKNIKDQQQRLNDLADDIDRTADDVGDAVERSFDVQKIAAAVERAMESKVQELERTIQRMGTNINRSTY